MNGKAVDRENGRVRSGLLTYLLIAIAIQILLASFYWAKSKGFAFIDIGSDTFLCFYPLQVAVSHQLQELHSITWSFELGLGGFLGSLIDPLWLIFGWLPDSWQLPLRLPMFALRSILGGAFFFGYLRVVGFRAPLSVLGGLGYAFCSYAMINAQWEVMHGTEFVQFSAYLFLLERYLSRGSRWAAVCAGIAVGLGHPLGLYMFALFTLVYGALRICMTTSGARVASLQRFVFFGSWCVLGIAITAPLLLPAAYYLLESPRVSGGYSQIHTLTALLLSLNDRMTIASEIAGLVGKDLLNTTSHFAGWGNYFEAPSFYVGLLPLISLPQLLGPSATRRERLLLLIGMAGIALYFVWPALRYAVYGFGHAAFRFSTLWISVLILLLGLVGLRRALQSGWWRPGVAISVTGVLLIVVGALVSIPSSVNVAHVLRVIAFTAVYATLALSIPPAASRSAYPTFLLTAIFACELLLFAVPAMIDRTAVNSDGSSQIGRYDDASIRALAFIRHYDQSGEFFRIEKTYDSIFLDDSLVQRYEGTESYFFHASSVTRFVDQLGLPRTVPAANYISSMVQRRDIIDLLGVKYVISRDREPDGWRDMAYLTSTGNLIVYQNKTARAFGSFYRSFLSEAQANSLLSTERDASLRTNVVVEDPTAIDAQLTAMVSKSDAATTIQRAEIRKLRDDALTGRVATAAASLLLLSMPFDIGWSAELDGNKLQLFRADFGLTAALIPTGRHTIKLVYVPPGRQLGWWVMAGALVLIAVLAFISRVRPAHRASMARPARDL